MQSPPFEAPATSDQFRLTRYVNRYDDGGALVATSISYEGPSVTNWPTTEVVFDEDDNQRCVRIASVATSSTGEKLERVEERYYDAAGRLERAELFGAWAPAYSAWCRGQATTLWTYDDQGRLVQERFWCNQVDEEPHRSTTIRYRKDGSQRVERRNRMTDIAQGTIVTERSAYCSVIDAWRSADREATRPPATRCVF